jgi:hypothetical protein
LYTYVAKVCYQCFICVFLVDVVYVLSGCCVCLQWFSSVFRVFSSVLEACFKCFICLQTYVASVAFGCFKSTSGVASLLLAFYCIASVSPPPTDADWSSTAPPLFSMLVTFGAVRYLCGHAKWLKKQIAGHGCPVCSDVRALASPKHLYKGT